ncbi:MAG: amidohydrolase family protein, partial [Bacteroidota bacterium]
MRVLLSLLLSASLWSGLSAQTKYLHCGHLIDGTSRTILTEQTIVVEGKNIVEVRAGYQTPPSGAELIDLKDHYVLPGMMDMHVHIEHESNPKRYENKFREDPADVALKATQYCERTLMAGFTTIRDLGGTGVN